MHGDKYSTSNNVYMCVLSGNDVISVGGPVYLQTSLTTSSSTKTSEGSVMVPGISPGGSSMSPKSTGATVHHLGPTDPRDSPFAHLRSQLQSVAVQDPSRSSVSITADRRLSSESSTDTDMQACKRIKLEPPYDVSSLSSSPLYYRTLYVNSRENELQEMRSSYEDHVTELFFLENNGNLMDYIAWSKRPNQHLSRLLQSASLSLDNADDTKAQDEVCNVCHTFLLFITLQ